MESITQLQTLVSEHAYTVGLGLLVAVLVAAVAWYWMSRREMKSEVLVNQARVNAVTTDSAPVEDIPPSAASPEPMGTQEHEE